MDSLPRTSLLPSAESEADRFSNCELTEDAFDSVYPEAVRSRSTNFWTPVAVARLAARFLAPEASARVLDVGSGAGKFCIVGAEMTGAQFSGIEQRPHLVRVAERAARDLGVSGVHFTAGTIEDVDWLNFDSFYFFNPFEENLYEAHEVFDRTVCLSEERFRRDAAFVERKLVQLPVGTRVATYHGFGGQVPSSYVLVEQYYLSGAVLRLWTKASEVEADDMPEVVPRPEMTPPPPDNVSDSGPGSENRHRARQWRR